MPIILGGSVGTGSGGLTYVTVADLIKRCRWRLEDRPTEDQTAGTITDSALTLAVDTYTLFDKGSWFEWDDTTYEEALVTATPGSSPITIKRGHLGSTAAAHGDDVRLLIRPRYPRQRLYQAILDAISSLSPRVWSPVTQTVTPSATELMIEANSDAEGVIGALQKTTITAPVSFATYGGKDADLPVSLIRHLPTATFSSGKAWYFPSGFENTSNTIEFTYPASPTTSTVVDGTMADYVVARAVANVALDKQFPRTSLDAAMGDSATSTLDLARLAAQSRGESRSLMSRLQADFSGSYGFSRWYG